MLQFIAGIQNFFYSLYALLFPMAAAGGSVWSGVSATGRWLIRSFVGLIFLLFLWWLNNWPFLGLSTSKVINLQYPYNGMWLPAIALCAYGMLWLGWWLWMVLNLEIEPPTSEFPDIDQAWAEATAALEKAGIKLDQTPLYLVLGWTIGEEEALYQAAGIKPLVHEIPRGPAAPLHVTANREAVWVTCPGTSLLGRLDPAAYSITRPESAELDLLSLSEQADEEDANKSIGIGKGANETLRLDDFVSELKKKGQLRPAAPRIPRKSDAELAPIVARLKRLCRLIARDRKGFCPSNGILVVLPVTCSDSPAQSEEVARACSGDLDAIFETFRLRCPVLFLMNKLDALPGFTELAERLPKNQKASRMGQRFPLVPELGRDTVPARVEESISFICKSLFPTMVLSQFQVESPGGEDLAMSMESNARMVRFLNEIGRRSEPLSGLVRACLPALKGEPVMFGGCYFAAAGRDPSKAQAFASGVFSRLIRDQDNVTWTQDAILEDVRRLRLVKSLKVGLSVYLALIAVGTVALFGRMWSGSGTPKA